MIESGCPTEEELAALVEGKLEATEAAEAHRHIRSCSDCGLVLAGLGDVTAAALEGDDAFDELFEAGDSVGRFVLNRVVGVGGMGAVWAARDPGLDRAVALKLVRPGPGSGGDARKNRRRLLDEAKAMANLAHPNVVPVFEVGEVGDQLFVVMELVEGETLRKWLKRPHPLAEILAVFAAAGSGLAAAHAAKIVHRDFKPDNVLMGNDGRPRVTDFGLARTALSPNEPVSPPPLLQAVTPHGTRTPHGVLLGTPAYMAPEQLEGKSASAASDLFSFCTALHEAIYGVRPFSGPTLRDLRASIRAGLTRLPPSPRVPSAVRTLLLRGLAHEPSARPLSMDVLVRALGDAPRLRRRRKIMWGAGIAGAVALGAVATTWLMRPGVKVMCRESAQRFSGLWDEPRQQQIQSAFLATHTVYANDAYQRVAAAFDRFRDAWKSKYESACEASAEKKRDDAFVYLQMGCLTQQLASAQAKSDLFAEADEKVVEVAAAIAASLDDPASCARTAGRSAPPPPEPWQRSVVEHVRQRLVRARSLSEAGRYSEALPIVQEAVTEADKTKWPPLSAEAQLELAQTLSETDEAVRALDTAMDAALAAEASRHDEVAAKAWLLAVQVSSLQLGRIDQSRDLQRHARAAVQRLGGDDLLEAHLENSAGNLLLHEGKLKEAEEVSRRALALYDATGRQDQFSTWLLNDEATALNLLGRVEESAQLFRRTADMKQRLLGARHPDFGITLSNLGSTLTDIGRYGEAQVCLDEASEILRASLKPDHFWILGLDTNLGDLAYARQDYPLARTWYERSIALGEASAKPGHSFTLQAEIGLGRTLIAQGEPAAAITVLEHVLSGGYQFEMLDFAAAQFALARAQVAAGKDPAAARSLAQKARANIVSTGQSGTRALAELDSWLQKGR